jgi:hypothetical protein
MSILWIGVYYDRKRDLLTSTSCQSFTFIQTSKTNHVEWYDLRTELYA